MTRPNEPTSESPQGAAREPAHVVVRDLLSLPIESQLGVLRTAGPRILARLEPAARASFLRVFQEDIDRAAQGERTYDLRPNVPPTH